MRDVNYHGKPGPKTKLEPKVESLYRKHVNVELEENSAGSDNTSPIREEKNVTQRLNQKPHCATGPVPEFLSSRRWSNTSYNMILSSSREKLKSSGSPAKNIERTPLSTKKRLLDSVVKPLTKNPDFLMSTVDDVMSNDPNRKALPCSPHQKPAFQHHISSSLPPFNFEDTQ